MRTTQSLSQIITTFGPGAMMDLPTRSIVVSGLDDWDTKRAAFRSIEEPRLAAFLESQLREQGRWPADRSLSFRTPPITEDVTRQSDPPGITVRIFPTWFVCEAEGSERGKDGQERHRRLLVRWSDLEARGGKRRYAREDGKKVEVTPMRFVAACEKGHLQDIDWRWVLHRGIPCQEAMWIEERGTSADPADIGIGCGCGRMLRLNDAFKPGFLGRCHGRRPWLDADDPDGCDQNLHFLSRSATNTYFSQTVTVISLPQAEDVLTRVVEEHWTVLNETHNAGDVQQARRFNPVLRAALEGHGDEEVSARIEQLRQGTQSSGVQNPRVAEFDILASGKARIGEDSPRASLFAETLDRAAWTVDSAGMDLAVIERVVVVHRLREVTCLYGFTRLEPAPVSTESDLEDVRLAVDGAPLAVGADWLPALEQFGEGLFLQFASAAIRDWLARPAVQGRARCLLAGVDRWQREHPNGPKFPGIPYVLLHSLSHALMSEIALDCGYPLSSLKERIYAVADPREPARDRFGVLIYTASAGAQGTLGGLIATALRLPFMLRSAIERLGLCSNDPVCADHMPDVRDDDRPLHGAACHSCMLVPETSCESRNLFLDRACVVETVATVGAGFLSRD